MVVLLSAWWSLFLEACMAQRRTSVRLCRVSDGGCWGARTPDLRLV